jgi:uncharacterized damage-inducible protein DinB
MASNSQPIRLYDTIETLFRHNLWANVRLFEACANLSDEQLAAKITGTYGSIRDTLQHIVTSERSYLHRITTGQPYPRVEGAPPMTMSEMQASIRASGEGLISAAPNVKAGDSVEVNWQGTPRMVPLTIFLTQAINHATEHRAQIMATLTHIGIEPPSLDGWTYFDSM